MNRLCHDQGEQGVLKSQRRGFGKVFSVIFFLLLGILAPAAMFGWSEFTRLFEQTSPTITVKTLPQGIGAKPVTIEIEVSDGGIGVDEVIVRREQDGDSTDILKKRYTSERKNTDIVSFTVSGQQSGIREGEVKFSVIAWDKSFWSNKSSIEFDLKVDYKPPVIEVLTTQHNAVRGGSELVFYRVTEKEELVSGVRVGSRLFPGFRAKNLDKDFESSPDIYFAFFAIPLEFNEDRDEIRVYARDPVENTATAPFYYRIAEFQRAKRNVKLSPAYASTKLEPLYKDFAEQQVRANLRNSGKVEPAQTVDEQISRFRELQVDFRSMLDRSIDPILASAKTTKFWDGHFTWLAGSTRAYFGEEQQFTLGDADAGSFVSHGVDLASGTHSPVRASNRGIVIFADKLGVYGNTVIVDHGFGLTTMYSNLSKIDCREGDRVEQMDPIGQTGNTGLAEYDAVHYEIRLFGLPVRPVEWWDEHWVEDHVIKKIAEVKKILGLKVQRPIDE